MPRERRIHFVVDDTGASMRYRVEIPCAELARRGHDATFGRGLDRIEAFEEHLADGGVEAAIEIHDWTTGVILLLLYHLRGWKRNLRQVDRLVRRIVEYRQTYPGRPIYPLSALTGQGVAPWLGHMLAQDPQNVGQQRIDVDYDRYAQGEADLGWLNLTATLTSDDPNVIVTQPLAAYRDTPAYSRRSNSAPFQVSVLPSFVCGNPINLHLAVSSSSHGSSRQRRVLIASMAWST